MLELVTPTVRTLHRREYLYDSRIRVIYDRLNGNSEGLKAWVEVRWIAATPPPALVAFGRFDLMSSRTVPSLARQAEKNLGVEAESLPLSQLLTALCYDVVRDHLEGDPAVRLSDITPDPTSWLLKPLIGGDGSTSFVGPGGVGKSFLAIAAGLAVATGRTGFLGMRPQVTGPVLYLDWEAGVSTQARRVAAVCAPLNIPVPDTILYRKPRGKLWDQADQVAALVEAEGVRLVVIDSVMLARGAGDPNAAEGTINLYAALNEIGVPTLLVDHKSREAMRKGWAGAYGSVVNDNSSRLMWEFQPSPDLPDGRQQFKLVQTKNNNTRKHQPLAFEVEFGNDAADELSSVKVTPIDWRTVMAMSEDAPLADRIETALNQAGNLGMTNKELAEHTGKSAGVVGARLNDLKKRGRVLKRLDRWFTQPMDDQKEMPDAY